MNLLLNLSKRIKRIRFFSHSKLYRKMNRKKAEYLCTVGLQIHTLPVISHKFFYAVKTAIPTPAKLVSIQLKTKCLAFMVGKKFQARFLPTMQ